ncbi:hypothetical protein ACFSUD_05505 [Sulfitobacter aestuarii]|uniref:Transferrin-binding protein B C-lobe/N-lobe beta barrel domain-containing protein n=1 Tax=Sulfitobacter aestuarii TaxID=2161676 RepID=A0ABW5U232_9RHOB
MKINAAGLLLCMVLAGCGGTAPFGEEDETETGNTDNGGSEDGGSSGSEGGSGTGGDDSEDNGIVLEGLPPGTTSPSPTSRIVRSEPTQAAGGKEGDGFATGIRYEGPTAQNATRDRFIVDGLAFDAGNIYARGENVSSLNAGEFAVYEAYQQYPDSLNGELINQFRHRAIYGVSKNLDDDGKPLNQFAIVRTGAYVGYGFGGFVYQRENGVTLPNSGQAIFHGKSAGLRDFEGRGGLEYATANVDIAIDFDDFNDQTGRRGDGVKGVFSDRRVFDIDGNDITQDVLDRINTVNDASLAALPDAMFTVGPGVMDDNGEIVGQISSQYINNGGEVQEYEAGKYYAILSGDDPNEIVGVTVMENSSEFENATVRETSGFIVYRDPAPAP